MINLIFRRTVQCIFLLVMIEPFILFAQEEKDFPALSAMDIPNGKILQSSFYNGNALWGLIDGGADIFLEYGFDKLLFQEVEWQNIKFRVEIYKMLSEKSAFGIFSVSRFKCSQEDTLTKFICITQYQVQAAVGRFYISISNERGDVISKNSMLGLFTKVLSKTNETIFNLPERFKNNLFSPYLSNMKLIKGTLGIQNGFPNWLELFDGLFDYTIYILPIETENGYINISQIDFTNEKDLQKFRNTAANKKRGKEKIWSSISSPSELIFIETTLSETETKKFVDALN